MNPEKWLFKFNAYFPEFWFSFFSDLLSVPIAKLSSYIIQVFFAFALNAIILCDVLQTLKALCSEPVARG